MKFAMYKYSYEHSSTINKILYYFTWPIYQTTFKYIKTVYNICTPRTPAKFFNFEVPDIHYILIIYDIRAYSLTSLHLHVHLKHLTVWPRRARSKFLYEVYNIYNVICNIYIYIYMMIPRYEYFRT